MGWLSCDKDRVLPLASFRTTTAGYTNDDGFQYWGATFIGFWCIQIMYFQGSAHGCNVVRVLEVPNDEEMTFKRAMEGSSDWWAPWDGLAAGPVHARHGRSSPISCHMADGALKKLMPTSSPPTTFHTQVQEAHRRIEAGKMVLNCARSEGRSLATFTDLVELMLPSDCSVPNSLLMSCHVVNTIEHGDVHALARIALYSMHGQLCVLRATHPDFNELAKQWLPEAAHTRLRCVQEALGLPPPSVKDAPAVKAPKKGRNPAAPAAGRKKPVVQKAVDILPAAQPAASICAAQSVSSSSSSEEDDPAEACWGDPEMRSADKEWRRMKRAKQPCVRHEIEVVR